MPRGIAHAVLWRRLFGAGHDACSVVRTDCGWEIEGAAAFKADDGPAWLQYNVACDDGWMTQRGRVSGWVGSSAVDLSISRAENGVWSVNGGPIHSAEGVADLDLGFTPATNGVAIRRMSLGVGGSANVVAVWLDGSDWIFKLLSQSYARIAEDTYRYASPIHGYEADLRVDPFGWVVDYPGLWTSG
jgi:uncharacterized protein